jgi:tetratricopeptide (TPR) repeat protein
MGKSICRISLIIIFLVSLSVLVYSQDQEAERFAKRIENIAQEYYRIGDYTKALEGYLMLDSINPGNTEYNYHIGICYLNSGSASLAYPYLEFANQQDDAPEGIMFELARAYHLGMEFNKAIIMYESYKKQIKYLAAETKNEEFNESEIDHFIQQCRNGLRLIRDPFLNTSITNLGPEINSEFDDFAPLLNTNEDLLIFTSKRNATSTAKSDPLTGQYFENVFISRLEDNSWAEATSIGQTINQDNLHNSAVGLSPNGALLFLYEGDDDRFSSRISGDLYMSSGIKGQWGKPEKIIGINSRSWESSATISGDESLLIISSDRPGGYGGTDLYVSRKDPGGHWTTPENMGAYINTRHDEDGPYIHPDGNKLYFSSKGHSSMGGYDIFYTEYIEDKQRWTRPVNMGFPINSADDDVYFVWSADGERAYFSSQRADTYGRTDIYVLKRKDTGNVFVKATGEIRDKIDQSPVRAEIMVRDEMNNTLIGVFTTEEKMGKYSLSLISGRKYRIAIEAQGYRNEDFLINTMQKGDPQDIIKNVTLTRNQ